MGFCFVCFHPMRAHNRTESMDGLIVFCSDCDTEVINVWITNCWHRNIIHMGSNQYGGRLSCGDHSELLRANSVNCKTYVK